MRTLFIRAAALLTALTLILSPTTAYCDNDNPLALREYIAEIVTAYETLTDAEIDDCAISSRLTTDTALRKALTLDILTPGEVTAARSRMLTFYDALKLLFRLRLALLRRAGLAGRVGSAAAYDAAAFALAALGHDAAKYGFVTADLTDNGGLTRIELCHIVVDLYEGVTGNALDAAGITFADTDDTYAARAVNAGFIGYFKNKREFEPLTLVTLSEMYASVLSMAEFTDGAAAEIDASAASELLAQTLLSCAGLDEAAPPSCVINDAQCDWYVNQLNTGRYSLNNCMPACGEMLLNYIDPNNTTNAAELRALSPHEGLGWYDAEFEAVMRTQGVYLTSDAELTAENMAQWLDKGAIIVAMCNLDGGATGHAVVVYGYERDANGLRFIANDPLSTGINKYGSPNGCARIFDATTLIAAMRRHATRFFVLPAA